MPWPRQDRAFSNRARHSAGVDLMARPRSHRPRLPPAVKPIVDVALTADGTLTFANAAVDAGVAAAPAVVRLEWARFDNATGETTPLASAPCGRPSRAAPGRCRRGGAYVSVQISATGGPKTGRRRACLIAARRSWTLVASSASPSSRGKQIVGSMATCR